MKTNVVFFALITGLFSSQLHADLITNGSFELGTYSPVVNTSYVSLAAGATNITGWTIGGAGVDWHQNSYEMKNANDGTKMVDLNKLGGGLSDTGTLSQSFSTTVGSNYDLIFYLAGPDTTFPNPRQVRVDIAGVSQIFSQAASSNLNLIWGRQELVFRATAPTTTLKFSSVNGTGYWGPFLDSVSVLPTVVPEPSASILFLIGLAGFTWVACTRNRGSISAH